MDRKKFLEEINKANNTVDDKYFNDVLSKCLKPLSLNKDGTYNLVVCMEELAELQKEISKCLRGERDSVGLLEELADAYLSIKCVQTVCNISDDDFYRAVNVKLNRQNNLNNNN